jgi:hypothetical protein
MLVTLGWLNAQVIVGGLCPCKWTYVIGAPEQFDVDVLAKTGPVLVVKAMMVRAKIKRKPSNILFMSRFFLP